MSPFNQQCFDSMTWLYSYIDFIIHRDQSGYTNRELLVSFLNLQLARCIQSHGASQVGKKIYTYIYRKFWTMTGIKVNAGWRFIISFPCFASTATTSATFYGGKVSVSSMTQVHTTYKSEFLIKTSVHLDNFTEFRKLDIFDSKLTVWEDYLVGIQLLLTGKIWKFYVNDMQNDFKNFQM